MARLAYVALLLLPLTGGAATPTNDEQYMLELINRLRTDPADELGILTNISGTTWLNPKSDDPDVASALTYFKVDAATLVQQWSALTPVAPLAWNSNLNNSAYSHNQAMIASDTQSHQVAGEPSIDQRLTDAGYAYTGYGENVYAYADSVFYAHAAFAIDWGSTATGLQSPPGHRNNLMSSGLRELGVSIVPESNPNTSVGPLVITEDFGVRAGNPFLTGVVFNDTVTANHFYTPGEGLGNVHVAAFAAGTLTLAGSTDTWSSGGYTLQLANGSYDVRFTEGSVSTTFHNITVANGVNTALDWMPIPEPGSGALLGAVLTAGALSKRRRRVRQERSVRSTRPR